MKNERTHVAFTVKGEAAAIILAGFFITESMPFKLDPFPNDKWNFVFKTEGNRDKHVSHFLEVIHKKYQVVYCDGWD